MSWWNSLEKAGQISKLAYSALKNAQQKIDEVLDIDDNIEEESKITSEFQTQLHTGLHTSQTEPSAYHICVNDHTQVPESTPIESALGCDVFTSNSFPKSTGSHSDDETVLDKQMHLEYNLSFTNREVTTSPNLNDRSLSPVQSSDDVDSHRRTLSALNLFSAHSVKESPRTHRASGSVGDNLNSSPLGPFDAVQTLTLAFEPDTTATGSDIEVLSGCTSTNGDSGHPIVTSIAPLERTVLFQNPPDGMSRPVNPGTVDGTHTLSALPRHRRAVSASNAFHLESSRPQEEDLSFAFQRLLKNYADKKALLRIRETKILQLSRENCGLREVNATLGEQLKGRGTPQDLSELTAEFTERLAQTECRLRLVSRERDQLKLSLASAQAKLKSSKKPTDTSSSIADTVILNKRIAELERALNEKTVQVSQLMHEGEQLAQFQLKGNTTIKQLRAKEKDARKSERILSEKNEQLNSQIERLRNDFRAKEDAICELTGQLEHVAKITQAQEAELQTIKVRYTHTQSSLKEKDNQIDDLNRALLDLQSRLTEAETRAGQAARSSASEQTLRESCATLREQLDAARAEANSLKRTSDERYAQWREEREYYQRLIAEANSRLESMEEHAQSAVQPALRQLESLQAHMAEQTEDWHRREIVLNQQLTECQKSALASSESERAARQQLRILETKLTELGKNNSQLQSEEKRLKEQLDVMSEKLRLACQTEKDLSSQLVSLNAERKVDEEQLGNLKVQLRQEQLAREVITRENEQVREQFRQLRLQTVQQSGRPDCTSDYPISQHSVEMEDRFSSKSETEPISEIVPPSPSTSVHRSVAVDTVESPHTIRLSKEMGSHAHLEYMQALVSLKDGELAQLRREVEQLTRAKNTLLNELATASANSERLARLTGQSTEHFATDSQMDEFQELQRRYNALLVLHGQVTEENTELRMDLADMKEMYKAQIDMLLRDQ